MAKPPWARLTKPIRPMVTESPTETMNSTMPAATPPSSMLATSMPKIHGQSPSTGRGDRAAGGRRICKSKRERVSAARAMATAAGDARVARSLVGAHGPTFSSLQASFTFSIWPITFWCSLPSEPFTTSARYSFMTMSRVCRVDHDRTLRAVELPALERLQRLVAVHLALGGLRRRATMAAMPS